MRREGKKNIKVTEESLRENGKKEEKKGKLGKGKNRKNGKKGIN